MKAFPEFPLDETAEDDIAEVCDKDGDIDFCRTRDYKIRYTINCLPIIDEHIIEDENGKTIIINKGHSFIEACCDLDDLSVFEC